MGRRRLKINVRDAVMAVVKGGKSKQGSIDRKTLKRIRAALRTGDWRIFPRYVMGL